MIRGGGHRASAEAIQAALHRIHPDQVVILVVLMVVEPLGFELITYTGRKRSNASGISSCMKSAKICNGTRIATIN